MAKDKINVDDYVLITESNRKNAVVIGRIIYYLERSGLKLYKTGHVVITPCLPKGWWLIPHEPWVKVPRDVQNKTHWNCYLESGMDEEAWAKNNKYLIDRGIELKTMYIKPSDPILTYIQSKK